MTEKKITIIIPSFQNVLWYERNLSSVFGQDYDNYKVIYTEDYSGDATADLAEKFIQKSDQQHRTTFIRNSERKGALHNLYDMIHSCENDSIILTVDGDDWLYHSGVLKRINEEYSNKDIWMSYGSYIDFPGNTRGCAKPYEKEIIERNAYRYVPWRASHLRTFYAGLFKKINKEDMMYDGKFYESAWDLSFMLPLLELCNGKFSYIDDILYAYNNQNPISDYKVKAQQQAMFDGHIRGRKQYSKLENLF